MPRRRLRTPLLSSSTLSSSLCLPDRLSHKKWSHLLDVLRSLPRSPHGLHARRKRIQLLADQADHEVIIVLVQTEAGEPDIGREAGLAECVADLAVLAQDGRLLLRRQRVKCARPAQGVPNCPWGLAVGDGAFWFFEQPVLQIRLVAQRV